MKELMASPPAIVVRAESEDVAGFKELAAELESNYIKQRKAQDESDIHGLEIGRLIWEFSVRPEIEVKVARLNKEKKPDGGRPRSAHCWVAERVAEVGELGKNTPSTRHMERCYRAFMKAKKKGLSFKSSLRVAEASDLIAKFSDKPADEMQPSPERLFNPEPGEDDEKTERFDADREAIELAKMLRPFFFTASGIERIRNKDQRRKFFEALNKSLEQLKIPAAFEPHETK